MPMYEFKCPKCGEPMVRNLQAEAAGPHLDREFRKPIEMHSLGLAHPEDIRAFKQRNPGVDISDDPDDELYGVPIARTRKQKLSILKSEGFHENN